MDTKTSIRQFLAGFFKNYDLQDDEDIFSLGFVGSLFAMRLIVFIEEQFQIKVENEDMDINNFRTINVLADFIKHKQTSAARST